MYTVLAEGRLPPLAIMGVVLDRYLPGHNTMLENEAYVTVIEFYTMAFKSVMINGEFSPAVLTEM